MRLVKQASARGVKKAESRGMKERCSNFIQSHCRGGACLRPYLPIFFQDLFKTTNMFPSGTHFVGEDSGNGNIARRLSLSQANT